MCRALFLGAGATLGKVSTHTGLTWQNVNSVVEVTQDLASECLDLGIMFQNSNVTLNKSPKLCKPQFIHI